jgi:hypothetical protein
VHVTGGDGRRGDVVAPGVRDGDATAHRQPTPVLLYLGTEQCREEESDRTLASAYISLLVRCERHA